LRISIEILNFPTVLLGNDELVVRDFTLLGRFAHAFKLLKVGEEDVLLL
jgi:hypothetical protein